MTSPETSPFDDIRGMGRAFALPDDEAVLEAQALRVGDDVSQEQSDIIDWLAAWQGEARPQVVRPGVALYATVHGIAVSAGRDVARVSAEMEAIQTGIAPQHLLSGKAGAGLRVFDLATEMPCPDIADEPSSGERDCAATIGFGMEAVDGGMDLLILSDLGGGGDLATAALLVAAHKGGVSDWMSRLSDAEQDLVEKAVARAGSQDDPLAALAEFGGRDLSALVGAIMAARIQSIPVLLDGSVALVASIIVEEMVEGGSDHCRLAGEGGAVSPRLMSLPKFSPISSENADSSHGVQGLKALQTILDACNRICA